MKKNLLSLAMLLVGAWALVACSNDEETPYVPKSVDVTSGVFVVCSGNMSSSIIGGLTYYDYETKTVTPQAFKSVNGRELGLTANDALVYEDKMYIVVDNENTIEVVDKGNLKSIKQIKLKELMADGQGAHPRHIIAQDGKLYVSNYGTSSADWAAYTVNGNGSVAVIDAKTYELKATYAVGGYPEGLAIVGNNLYVLNSNYGMGNGSISKINLSTGAETKISGEDIMNPVDAVSINGSLYYLDSGSYDYNPPYAQINAGVRKVTENGEVTKVLDATAMCSDGKKIYVINSPYGLNSTSYSVYDVATSSTSAFTPSEEVEYPNTIGVDPITNNVFIASNSKDPDTGKASYKTPGYVKQYKADGSFVTKFDCWVGPCAIIAKTSVKYE
jgi:YVTN family beta-propeller protein